MVYTKKVSYKDVIKQSLDSDVGIIYDTRSMLSIHPYSTDYSSGFIALGFFKFGVGGWSPLNQSLKGIDNGRKAGGGPHSKVLFSVVGGAKGQPWRVLAGQRSGSVAGSWQANPRETLRGSWSVWCCGGRDEGRGQEGSDYAVVGRLAGRLASAVARPAKIYGSPGLNLWRETYWVKKGRRNRQHIKGRKIKREVMLRCSWWRCSGKFHFYQMVSC